MAIRVQGTINAAELLNKLRKREEHYEKNFRRRKRRGMTEAMHDSFKQDLYSHLDELRLVIEIIENMIEF